MAVSSDSSGSDDTDTTSEGTAGAYVVNAKDTESSTGPTESHGTKGRFRWLGPNEQARQVIAGPGIAPRILLGCPGWPRRAARVTLRAASEPFGVPVAQWIERPPSKRRVVGSNPAGDANLEVL